MEANPQPSSPPASSATRSALRRYLEVTLILITWVAMGKLLHLDDSAYVVAGVPIVAFFQLIIRRQPLRALWIREAPPFRLNSKLVFALPLTVLPSLSTI